MQSNCAVRQMQVSLRLFLSRRESCAFQAVQICSNFTMNLHSAPHAELRKHREDCRSLSFGALSLGATTTLLMDSSGHALPSDLARLKNPAHLTLQFPHQAQLQRSRNVCPQFADGKPRGREIRQGCRSSAPARFLWRRGGSKPTLCRTGVRFAFPRHELKFDTKRIDVAITLVLLERGTSHHKSTAKSVGGQQSLRWLAGTGASSTY